ncbi:MAG: recombinase family protein, partial [Pseudomonadota bacterium]
MIESDSSIQFDEPRTPDFLRKLAFSPRVGIASNLAPMSQTLGIGAVRVSTDKQFHEGDSLDNQMARIDRAASRDGVSIVRYFIEHYSGRKTDRVVIRE